MGQRSDTDTYFDMGQRSDTDTLIWVREVIQTL